MAAGGTDAERPSPREETVSIAIASAAAVTTSWLAFEAATWSGVQAFALARATRLRQQSTEARLEADQQQHLDVDLFVAYASAYAEHKEGLATFLLDRFPPRLKTATDAWLATKPLATPTAPPHPFAMTEYHLDARTRAAIAERQAEDALTEGANANRISDLYVLGTVLLATIILLASVGTRLYSRRLRRAMIVASVLALASVIAWTATRPVEWAGVKKV